MAACIELEPNEPYYFTPPQDGRLEMLVGAGLGVVLYNRETRLVCAGHQLYGASSIASPLLRTLCKTAIAEGSIRNISAYVGGLAPDEGGNPGTVMRRRGAVERDLQLYNIAQRRGLSPGWLRSPDTAQMIQMNIANGSLEINNMQARYK